MSRLHQIGHELLRKAITVELHPRCTEYALSSSGSATRCFGLRSSARTSKGNGGGGFRLLTLGNAYDLNLQVRGLHCVEAKGKPFDPTVSFVLGVCHGL